MTKLTEPMQMAIVQALACFDTPSEVAEAVKERFGIAITRQQVAKYDPTKVAGEKVSAKLRAVFDAARAAFLTNMQDIPISNLCYRLRRLQRALEKAESQHNFPLAMQILKQAAMECGGIFTSRREQAPAALAADHLRPIYTLEMVAERETKGAIGRAMRPLTDQSRTL